MRMLITALLLTLTGTASANSLPMGVRVIHDEARGVTCWLVTGGISCLPDSQLQRQQAASTNDEPATPASTPTPRSHEEAFQL